MTGGPRVRRLPGRGSDLLQHGPVRTEEYSGAELIEFFGPEECDVLHAAGAWMADHPYAALLAVNWRGDQVCEHDERFAAGQPDRQPEPEYLLQLVVDHSDR